MLLIHGLGEAASEDWAPVVPALAAKHRVHLIDLPGFGRSARGNQLYSPDRLARAVARAIRARRLAPLVVVAHSLGGGVGIELAAGFPELVERLVLIDVAGVLHRTTYIHSLIRSSTGPVSSLPQALVSLLSRRGPNPSSLLHSPLMRAAALRSDPSAIAALALVEHWFGPALDRVRAPVLVLWGRDDRVAPLRTGVTLAARLGAQLAVRSDVGHVPMKQAPGWTARQVVSFARAPRREAIVAAEIPLQPVARDASCDGQRDFQLSGRYRRVTLNRCDGARLTDVTADALVARHSRVEIIRGRLGGAEGSAMSVDESRVAITGTELRGGICVRTRSSTLDLAGVIASCSIGLAESDGASKLTLSVVRMRSSAQITHFHQVLVLPRGHRLVGL